MLKGKKLYWILLMACSCFSAVSIVSAQEDEGITIRIEGEESEAIPHETIRITSENGKQIGIYTSDASGWIQLPVLEIGEYEMELSTAKGYEGKEPVSLEVTSYNQKNAVAMHIVMNKKKHHTYFGNPSLILFFMALMSGCLYALFSLFRKGSINDLLDDDL